MNVFDALNSIFFPELHIEFNMNSVRFSLQWKVRINILLAQLKYRLVQSFFCTISVKYFRGRCDENQKSRKVITTIVDPFKYFVRSTAYLLGRIFR